MDYVLSFIKAYSRVVSEDPWKGFLLIVHYLSIKIFTKVAQNLFWATRVSIGT